LWLERLHLARQARDDPAGTPAALRRVMRRALVFLAAFASACAPPPDGEATDPLSIGPIRSAFQLTTMNVVAHEDDDILFMNNDLRRDLVNGRRVVSVYLTAGEAAGSGVHTSKQGSSCSVTTDISRETFAAHRQQAAMAAYAQMTGSSAWTLGTFSPDGVHTVETETLAGGKVVLVFVNLPDGGDPACDDGSFACKLDDNGNPEEYCNNDSEPSRDYALNNLFEVPTFSINTLLVNNGSSLRANQLYRHDDVVAVLKGVLATYQPSVVRTLDPHGNPSLDADNPDHADAAKFTNETLAAYSGHRTAVHYYVGYGLGYHDAGGQEYLPANLGYQDTLDKTNAGNAYGALDDNYPLGISAYKNWYSRTYPRHPSGVRWVEKTSANTLAAFAVEDRQLVMWAETSVGGPWTGPTAVSSGDPIAPGVTVVRRPDGRLQLFALRLPLSGDHENDPPAHEVITAIQMPPTPVYLSGPRFGAWRSLGRPSAVNCSGGAGADLTAGEVTGAIDGQSREFAFARDALGQPVYRVTVSSGTTPWQALACNFSIGPGTLEGIAAVTRDNGTVEAFVTTATGRVLHFLESSSGSLYDAGPFPAAAPITDAAGPPTATLNQDGRLEVFYREAGTGRVKTTWETPAGPWAAPGILYGDAGTGDVAAIRRGGTGEILLFERNVWGGISQTQQTAPNGGFSWWQWQILGGGPFDELPTATTDGAGRVVVLAKGEDGALNLRRETSSATVGAFDPWMTVGGYSPVLRLQP
jgi:LmbE family N-acetylglucosaminyl deacetylase